MSRRKQLIAQIVKQLSTGGQAQAHPKKQRLRSKKNLKLIRSLPCAICGSPPPNDPDHIKSRGAFGGDELSNLSPSCRKHHIERHHLGFKEFWNRYSTTIILFREKYDLPAINIDFITN